MRNPTLNACKALAVFLLAASAAQQEVKRDFAQSLPLSAGQKLEVTNRFGSIDVRAGGSEVVVKAVIRAAHDDRAIAEKIVAETQIEVQRTAVGVAVRTVYPDPPQRGVRSGWGNVSMSVNYDITMPAGGALEARGEFGSLRVSGIKGGVKLNNRHGSVTVAGCGAVNADNQFGALDVSNVSGAVEAVNQHGAVTVADATGIVNVKNAFGAVKVSRSGRNLTIRNQHGGVTVDSADTANLTNAFGEVSIGDVKGDLTINNQHAPVKAGVVGGSVIIRNSFGGLQLTEGRGPVNLTNQHGSITARIADGAGCRPVTISTSFSPVRLTLPAAANYDVSASTSHGKIRSDLPMTVSGTLSERSLTGTIGKGGCALRVSNQNGAIDLLK